MFPRSPGSVATCRSSLSPLERPPAVRVPGLQQMGRKPLGRILSPDSFWGCRQGFSPPF